MMGGEFELNPDFLWKEPVPGSGDISTQILFFMFVIFVTIIIANLLIGLTVNQTDKLFKEADIIRLQRVVYMIEFKDAFIEIFWYYFKPLFTQFGLIREQLFQYMYLNSAKMKNNSAAASNNNGRNKSTIQSFHLFLQKPWKVCVLPNSPEHMKINSNGRFNLRY